MKPNIGMITGCIIVISTLSAAAAELSVPCTQSVRANLGSNSIALHETTVMSGKPQVLVGRQEAGRIAREAIALRTGKTARVTWIGREDDFGARWEVEVTIRGGKEFDVYIDKFGKIVRVVGKAKPARNPPT
jgi:hypothetical protein